MRPTLCLTARVLVAFGLLALVSGCRSPRLEIDHLGDVSRHRTWDFVQPLRGVVHAPFLSHVDLESSVAWQIERWLFERGFQRTRNDPDVVVYFQLIVQAQIVKRNVTGVISHLASLHNSASYDIQTTQTKSTRYETADLQILMIDPRQRRLLWDGRLRQRYRNEFMSHLGEAVSQLLTQLPPPSSATGRDSLIVKEGEPQGMRAWKAPPMDSFAATHR